MLKQFSEQANIDSKYKNEFDELISNLESRVQKLKGSNPISTQKPEVMESEDEEDTIKKIIQKVSNFQSQPNKLLRSG